MRKVIAAIGLVVLASIGYLALRPGEREPPHPEPEAAPDPGPAGVPDGPEAPDLCRVAGVTRSNGSVVPATVEVCRVEGARTEIVATAQADGEGNYSIDGLAPGEYRLRAHADGDLVGARGLDLEPNGVHLLADIYLAEDLDRHTLSGRIVGLDDAAAAFLRLEVEDFPDEAEWPRRGCMEDEFRCTVGSAGGFRCEDLLAGELSVELIVPGRLRAHISNVTIPREQPLVLDLAGILRRVAITVLDAASGSPIPGAELELGDVWSSAQYDAVTGDTGVGWLRALPEKHYFEIRARGYPTARVPLDPDVNEIEVRLRRGSTLLARVVRETTGEPVSGAVVRIGGQKAVSDAHGRARIEGLVPGERFVSVFGEAWISMDRQEVDLPWNGIAEVELPVVRTVEVIGTVVDDAGNPVAGARVRLDTSPQQVATDAAGRFRLEGLRPGYDYELVAGSSRHVNPKPVAFRAGEDEPRIQFPPERYVEVRVLERGTDTPLEGVAVIYSGSAAETDATGFCRIGPVAPGEHGLWTDPEDHLPAEAMSVDTESDTSAVILKLARSGEVSGRVVLPAGAVVSEMDVHAGGRYSTPDEEGRFTIRGLTPGTHTVKAAAHMGTAYYSGSARAKTGDRDVVIELIRDESGDLDPEPEPLPDFVVRVLGPDGLPVPRADARWGVPEWAASARVEFGLLELPGDSRGATLTIYQPRDFAGMPVGAGAAHVVLPDDPPDDFEVRLPEEKCLTGRVLDEDGRPVAGARVRVEVRGEAPFEELAGTEHGAALSRADGTFEVGGLGDLPYRLVFEPSHSYLGGVPVAVKAGEAEVTVRLTRGVRSRLLIVGPDRQPAAGATVEVYEPAVSKWDPIAETVCNDDGEALLPALEPNGSYELSVEPMDDEHGLLPRREEWKPTERCTILLDALWSVRGEVIDWNGRPVGGIPVWFRMEDGSRWRAWELAKTDGHGQFRITKLEGGSVLLAAGQFASSAYTLPDSDPVPANGKELESRALCVLKGVEETRLVIPRDSSLMIRVPGHRYEPDDLDLRSEDGPTRHKPVRHHGGAFLYTGLPTGGSFDVWLRDLESNLVGYLGDLKAGDEADLVLTKGVELRGRCTSRDMISFEGAEIDFLLHRRTVRVEGLADGWFRIPCLPREEGDVEVNLRIYEPERVYYAGSARATPGEPVEVPLK